MANSRAQSRHCGGGRCGQSGPSCNWSAARATWQCSILRSTASCAVATSWRSGGRRGTQRLRGRQSNYPPEQNGSARPLRADRGHTPGAGRLPAGERTESGTILVPRPACPGSVTDDAPICSAGFPLDRRHRLGPTRVRDSFHAPDQGHAHLPAHGELTRADRLHATYVPTRDSCTAAKRCPIRLSDQNAQQESGAVRQRAAVRVLDGIEHVRAPVDPRRPPAAASKRLSSPPNDASISPADAGRASRARHRQASSSRIQRD